jgi:hypothetical protein
MVQSNADGLESPRWLLDRDGLKIVRRVTGLPRDRNIRPESIFREVA